MRNPASSLSPQKSPKDYHHHHTDASSTKLIKSRQDPFNPHHHPIPPPPWLASVKHHLIHHCESIQILRNITARELRSRLRSIGRLTPGGLAGLPSSDREELIRQVAESVRHDGVVMPVGALSTRVSNALGDFTGKGEDSREAKLSILWREARKEVEKAVNEKMAVAVMADLLVGDGQFSSDPIHSKIEIAVKESERAIISILSQWPDARSALRGCLNVPLPKSVRKMAWAVCLNEPDVVADYYTYLRTSRSDVISQSVGHSLFDACQHYLASHPTLIPLASQFRCVKRMEQSLLYILEPSSQPTLRHMNLSHPSLPKNRTPSADLIYELFGGANPLPNKVRNAASNQKPKSQIRPSDEGDNQEPKKGPTPLHRRQMASLVPFLKAFEQDANYLRQAVMPDAPLIPGMVDAVDSDSFTPGIAAAAEMHAVELGAGSGQQRRNRNVGVGKMGGLGLDDWAAGVSSEEEKTSRMVEAVSKFWGIMPESWKQEDDSLALTIAHEVEAMLMDMDPEVFEIISKAILHARKQGEIQTFSDFLDQLIGDFYVGKCNLDLLSYMFDQYITSSQELTLDAAFPTMNTHLTWFTTGILILLREPLLRTINLTTTTTESTSQDQQIQITELLNHLETNLPTLTPRQLSTHLELHIIHKFRKTIPFSVDLPQRLFGLDWLHEDPISSISQTQTSSIVKRNRKIGKYINRIKKGGDGINLFDNGGSDSEDDFELRSLREEDLVEAEAEVDEIAKIWYVQEKKRRDLKRRNMRRWKGISHAIGKWVIYLDIVKNLAHISAERRRQMLKTPEIAPLKSHRPSVATDRIISTPSQQPVLETIDEQEQLEMEARRLAELNLLMEEQQRQQLESQELKIEEVEEVEEVGRRVVVKRGTIRGQEWINLNPLGLLVNDIFDKVQLILQGDPTPTPQTINEIAHALSFQSILYQDLHQIIPESTSESQSTESLESPASNNKFFDIMQGLKPTVREKTFKSLERARGKRVAKDPGLEGGSEGRAENIEKAASILQHRYRNPEFVKFNKVCNLFKLLTDCIETALEGPPTHRATFQKASIACTHQFHTDEQTVFQTIFGTKIEYSPETIKSLVAPDKQIPAKENGEAASRNELKLLLNSVDPVLKISEKERRRKREGFFAAMDKVRAERYGGKNAGGGESSGGSGGKKGKKGGGGVSNVFVDPFENN
ncbi:hypothetical protein HDU76_011736 [Blyttiomyces sp. JEL0837]|nr:hypothetical protein HDU76_011736 [Blyttiomyces sp. JEL0837]